MTIAPASKRPTGMTAFTIIWAGQLISVLASSMTQAGGLLASTFGWLVGTEPGSGMALHFFFAGICYMLIVLAVYLFFPVVRNLEDFLPDHDQLEKVEEGIA